MLMAKGAFIDATNNNGAEPLQCCRPDTIRNGVKKFILEKSVQFSLSPSLTLPPSLMAQNLRTTILFMLLPTLSHS